jgi:phage tail-like protein
MAVLIEPRTTRDGQVDHRDGVVSAQPVTDRIEPSSYLRYLPEPFHEDDFVGRFLRVVEDILSPVERTVDFAALYFDPRLTPAELLPWLASWVGLELDENWPARGQRELLAWASTLYRWRGTRRGLRQHLCLYVGRDPLIVENFDGLRLGQDAVMEVNSRMGSGVRPHWITVTVMSDRPELLDEGILRRIIETEKPADVGYSLEVVRVSPPDGVTSP